MFFSNECVLCTDLEKRANVETLINQLYSSSIFETLIKISLQTYYSFTNTNAIAPGPLSPAAFGLVQTSNRKTLSILCYSTVMQRGTSSLLPLEKDTSMLGFFFLPKLSLRWYIKAAKMDLVISSETELKRLAYYVGAIATEISSIIILNQNYFCDFWHLFKTFFSFPLGKYWCSQSSYICNLLRVSFSQGLPRILIGVCSL